MLRQLKIKTIAKRTPEIQLFSRIGSPIVPLIFLLCIIFAFQIVAIRGTLNNLGWWGFWSLFALMVLFMVVFIYIGFKTSSVRYFAYAGLSLAYGSGNILGLINPQNTSHFLLMLGIIPFIIGLFLYVKFLRQAPGSK